MSTELLGYVAAILTTLSFLPQAIKTISNRDTKSLSLTMYSAFCLGVVLWLIYGFMIGNWPLILANGVTLLLSGIILTVKFINVVTQRE